LWHHDNEFDAAQQWLRAQVKRASTAR